MPPHALPTDPEPTHHATLTDRNGVTVPFVFADARGRRSTKVVRRTPLRRQGIKIDQGESSYGSLVPPFSEDLQDDWSGGLGLAQLEDRRRYYHGDTVDSSFARRLFLGPEPTMVAGIRLEARESAGNQDTNFPNPMFGSFRPRRYRALFGAHSVIAHEFVPNETFSATAIYLLVRRVGTPTGLGTLLVELRSGSKTGTVLRSGTLHFQTDNIPKGKSVLKAVTFTAQTLTAATTYAVRVQTTSGADDASNHFEVCVMGPSIFDNFTGGEGETVTGRKPLVRWTNAGIFGEQAPLWETNGAVFRFFSNKVGLSAGGTPLSALTIDCNHSDLALKCLITRGTGGRPGLITKWTSSADFVYAYVDGATLFLRKVNASVDSLVTSVSHTWAVGATKTMELRSDSTILIEVIIDGTVLISANPSPCANGNDHGVAVISGGGFLDRFDDFEAVRIASGSWRSSDGVGFFLGPEALAFRVTEAAIPFRAFPYEYKGGFYVLRQPDSGATPQLYINGDRGVATGAQTSTTLKDTTKVWVTNEFGYTSIVKIWAGTGREQWRRISSNTADTLTVTPAWDTTPVAASSEYVIVASEAMREITGHGIAGPVTDILSSSKEVVYFAQGEAVNIRRMRERVSAGAWVREFADDGTNKARHLIQYMDSKLGGRVAHSMNPDNSGSFAEHSPVPDWGVNLSFGGKITTGRDSVRITGLEHYGSPDQLWVLCQGEVGRVTDDKYNPLPLRETASVASELNGIAHIVHDLYLFFSLGKGGMERFYQDNLDNIGPNRDDGLEPDLRGPFSAYVGYPGKIFAATGRQASLWPSDARASIFRYDGAWHPWYVHPEFGVPIRSLYVQPIPGDTPDRLWFNVGGDLCYVLLPSDTFDPLQDDKVTYYHEGLVRLSWNAYGFKDRIKFFDALKVFAEKLYPGLREIAAGYDVDDDTGRHFLTAKATASPVSTLTIAATDNHQAGMVFGKRIQMDLLLSSADNLSTPILRAVVHSGTVFLDTKYRMDFTFRLKDDDVDLNGDPDPYPKAEGKSTQLETWAEAGELLTWRCILSPFDNHVVTVDPAALTPYLVVPDEQLEAHVGQVGIVEVR